MIAREIMARAICRQSCANTGDGMLNDEAMKQPCHFGCRQQGEYFHTWAMARARAAERALEAAGYVIVGGTTIEVDDTPRSPETEIVP